jgi:Ornithine cyclodeaminase/mu-crystallin family
MCRRPFEMLTSWWWLPVRRRLCYAAHGLSRARTSTRWARTGRPGANSTTRANTLLVDSRASAAQESGDVMLSKASIYAEIGELFAGNVAAPPRSTTTVFKSLGLAVEDLAAAKLVLELMAR